MSLMTSEIPSDSETMVITENSKRKFDEIDAVLKKCKLDSPTTTTFVDEQSNSILTDVTDNESTDSSDRSDKPMAYTTTISDNCDNDKEKKDEHTHATILCPQYGQVVNRREFRRAGPYIIGLKLGHSPVDSIVQYLAKKENTNEFVQLKVIIIFGTRHDVYIFFFSTLHLYWYKQLRIKYKVNIGNYLHLPRANFTIFPFTDINVKQQHIE